MSKPLGKWFKQLSHIMDLPPDVVMDLPKVTIVGNMEAHIENHQGILEYSQERIGIRCKTGTLLITGQRMTILFLYKEELKIAGQIDQVQLVSG